MKLLKRKILFVLGSEIDFFLKSDGLEYKNYEFLYGRLLGFKPSSIRGSVLQLVKTGEVDKIIRNGTPLFRLTSQGRDRLLSFFPISIGQHKVWDGIWRIALIKKQNDLSFLTDKKKIDNRRASYELRVLRRGLRSLGFKKLSRSIYITPLPISNQIKSFCLENQFFNAQIAVIESRRLIIGDNKQIAKQIWGLDQLVSAYQVVITKIDRLLSGFKEEKGLKNREKKAFSLILDLYFNLLEADPGLPKKLLSSDWPADLVKERFIKLALKVKQLEMGLDIV